MDWTEKRPNPGSTVERDDGRLCRIQIYEVIVKEKVMSTKPGKPAWRPVVIPWEIIKFTCGEMIKAKVVSLNSYYPVPTGEEVTCPGCRSKEAQKK